MSTKKSFVANISQERSLNRKFQHNIIFKTEKLTHNTSPRSHCVWYSGLGCYSAVYAHSHGPAIRFLAAFKYHITSHTKLTSALHHTLCAHTQVNHSSGARDRPLSLDVGFTLESDFLEAFSLAEKFSNAHTFGGGGVVQPHRGHLHHRRRSFWLLFKNM